MTISLGAPERMPWKLCLTLPDRSPQPMHCSRARSLPWIHIAWTSLCDRWRWSSIARDWRIRKKRLAMRVMTVGSPCCERDAFKEFCWAIGVAFRDLADLLRSKWRLLKTSIEYAWSSYSRLVVHGDTDRTSKSFRVNLATLSSNIKRIDQSVFQFFDQHKFWFLWLLLLLITGPAARKLFCLNYNLAIKTVYVY